MKRITNRILCEEVMGRASGEVVVRGQFSQWEIKARCENDYAVKFGGIWEVHLGQPEKFEEAPGCTMYEVTAKRVLKANTAPPPAPELAKAGPENDIALSAMGVANAAMLASQAALEGHSEDLPTYLKMIEHNASNLRTLMDPNAHEKALRIAAEMDASLKKVDNNNDAIKSAIDECKKSAMKAHDVIVKIHHGVNRTVEATVKTSLEIPKCPSCGKTLSVHQSGIIWTIKCEACDKPYGIQADSLDDAIRVFNNNISIISESAQEPAKQPADTRSLGQVAFDAFHSDGKHVDSGWSIVHPRSQEDWSRAASAVIAAYEARKAVQP